MSLMRNVIPFALYFSPWLLLLVFVLGVIAFNKRQRRVGKVTGLLAGLLLLLVITAYVVGDISWHLLPVLFNGYTYNPHTEIPDARLVPRRPDLIIERQLAALLGQTGKSPLHFDSPLVDYDIESVHIGDWLKGNWPTAVLDTTLNFANGDKENAILTIPAKGGTSVHIPFIGEVSRNAYAWYAPESSLGPLLQTPAPVTTLRSDSPPVAVQLVGSTDVAFLENVDPQTSLAVASDFSATGALLLDVDLRHEQASLGNALLRHSDGETQMVTQTWLSARATFAPDGQRIAYVRSQEKRPLYLVVRQADGQEEVITAVDWLTHHWVNNRSLSYSHDGVAYLHNLASGQRQALAKLPPHEFMGGQYFRVSPDSQRIAYADFDGRIWVKEISIDQQQLIGWDIASFGWFSGFAWRDDGQQLLFTTRNSTILPDQQALHLWDAASGQTTLLIRTGPGFLGRDQNNDANLGQACWLDDETILLAAYTDGYREVHLLVANTDGSGVWDVTPDNAYTFPELHCARNYIALNHSRTALDIYQVGP